MAARAPGVSPAAPIIELVNVTKSFGENNGTKAVDDVTLTVGGGQIFGLIGPSGCGKTTVIRLLLGIFSPTSGSLQVMGVEPQALTTRHRERIGYTPQGFYLYPTLTVFENTRFVAGLFGLNFIRQRRRSREVLQFLELWEARNRLARDLSGGMQRRLALACALLHEPTLLFVDEPTSGLDPMLRQKIWDELRELCNRGTSIFVTTQHIDEAAYCDNVAVLRAGKLLAVGAPATLRQQAMGGEIIDLEAEALGREDLQALRTLPGVHFVRWTEGDVLRLVVDDAATMTPTIVAALQERGVNVISVNPYEATFDEVFMRIVASHA